jgi:hypothetical protein
MRNKIWYFALVLILFSQQDDLKVWKEFVLLYKNNELSQEHIRPHQEFPREQLMETLNRFGRNVSWEEMESEPEIIRYDNQLNFLVTLTTTEGGKYTYCFSFILEGDKWYFQHFEGIFIRLDKIASLPTSEFPDLPEETKAWMREEFYWSKMAWIFNTISQNSGKDSAFNIFLDGSGYFLAAKAWVPFVPPTKAFILYLCWEQANLIGNAVTLEKLEDKEALVKIKSIYFALYRRTAHLKHQISFEDYRKIFETIWYDRAKRAGWNLKIEYRFEADECIFHFTR